MKLSDIEKANSLRRALDHLVKLKAAKGAVTIGREMSHPMSLGRSLHDSYDLSASEILTTLIERKQAELVDLGVTL